MTTRIAQASITLSFRPNLQDRSQIFATTPSALSRQIRRHQRGTTESENG
ncbi:hypothetical protein KDD30_21525 (plasmid) [Photobacterium sp. GJ3]|nr:hypothetical protein [Photobacterium sp. GJ3]QUJ69350.1 hypothetical protein KDD30_21525 [Photobacterium sp. GJ3]